MLVNLCCYPIDRICKASTESDNESRSPKTNPQTIIQRESGANNESSTLHIKEVTARLVTMRFQERVI